jgi:hypothetical protein
MNPDTMSVTELADWCARDEGYINVGVGCEFWMHHTNPTVQVPHPFPLTLDGAAKAMPEGWYWWVNFTGLIVPFMAMAIERVPVRGQIEVRAEDEITVRYRLGVKARRAAKGGG